MKNKDSRIIFVGAGTSGRIGVQEAVELFPTFNWPKSRLDYIIAGGERAILNSIENAEDDISEAVGTVSEKLINSAPIFDVIIIIVFLKFIVLPCESVSLPSSKT